MTNQEAFKSYPCNMVINSYGSSFVSIGNDDIVENSVEWVRTGSDDDHVVIGKCNPASFKFTMYRNDTKPIPSAGDKLVVEIRTTDTSGVEHTKLFGTFFVYSNNISQDRMYRDVIAYDRLFLLSQASAKPFIDAQKNQHGPTVMTFGTFREAFFEYCGLEDLTDSYDWVMDSKNIAPDNRMWNGKLNDYSCRDILEAMCEYNGIIGTVTEDDKFKGFTGRTGRASRPITKDDYSAGSVQYDEATVLPPTKMTVINVSGGYEVSHSYVDESADYSGDEYVIDKNIFTDSATVRDSDVNKIYGNAKPYIGGYCPFSITADYDSAFDLFDNPIVYLMDGTSITSSAHKITVAGLPFFKMKIEAKGTGSSAVAGGAHTLGGVVASGVNASKSLTQADLTSNNLINGVANIDSLAADSAIVRNISATAIQTNEFKAGIAEIDYLTATDAIVKNLSTEELKTNEFKAGVANIDYLKATDAIIKNLSAEELKTNEFKTGIANINYLTASDAIVKNLTTESFKTSDLKASVANINYLTASDAIVKNLSAESFETSEFKAGVAGIDYLVASDAIVKNLSTEELKTNEFKTGIANIDYLKATDAIVKNIQAKAVTTEYITAQIADIGYLKANDIEANTGTYHYLKADQLDATYADVGFSNVGQSVIKTAMIADEAVTSAKIQSISANKITAGTLDASKITVTNLNADNITAGTLNGQRIGKGSIALNKLAEEVTTKDEFDETVGQLQDEIDGAIETFTSTSVPTLNNYPTNTWETADYAKHVGDICYVQNAASDADGYSYRFSKINGSSYSWTLIKDSDVTKALQDLIDVQGDISGIKTFDSQVSSFMTNTDEELSSVKSRTSTLETDMGSKVSTTTFNTLSQTVDANTASISSLSETVSTKADGSTVSTLATKVNTVEQTANSNKASISSLTTTVKSKADSSTVTTLSNKVNTVEQTVDANTASISSLTTTVNSKADGSTVSSLSSKVNTIEQTTESNTASISSLTTTVNSKADSSTVTEISSTLNTVKQTADSNKASISSLNTTVASKADGSTVTTLSNRVSEVEQDLSGFKSTVSETYTTKTDFNKLSIGGRNLLLKSDTAYSNSGYPTANYLYGTERLADGEKFVIQLKGTLGSGKSFWGFYNSGGSKNVANATSADYDASTGIYTVKGTWIGASSTANTYLSVYPIPASASSTSSITWIKLEKGNKPTDWTPAPEDATAYTDSSVESAESKFNQRASSIELSVSKKVSSRYFTASAPGYTQAQLESFSAEGTSTTWAVTASTEDVDVGDTVYVKALNTTTNTYVYAKGTITSIPSATSLILTAHGMEDSLPSRTAISNINLSPETVKISASKVDIDGVVTFINSGTTTIDGSKITTGTITANEISSGAITTEKLATKAITAEKIATGTITATQIASGTITANEIATDTITANKIAAGAITASELSTGAVTTDKLDAKAVTAAKIATGTITANEIAGGTLTLAKLDQDANDYISTASYNANVAKNTADSAMTLLGIQDTRSTNETPSWYMTNYPRKTAKEFKTASVIGLPSGFGTYCELETVVPWADASGGRPSQVATFNYQTNKGFAVTFKRTATNDTTWGTWKSDSQQLSNWAHATDTTYIDGGTIYTNSIKADSIDVTDLFAQNITASGTITGATLNGDSTHINAGYVGNFYLQNGSLYAGAQSSSIASNITITAPTGTTVDSDTGAAVRLYGANVSDSDLNGETVIKAGRTTIKDSVSDTVGITLTENGIEPLSNGFGSIGSSSKHFSGGYFGDLEAGAIATSGDITLSGGSLVTPKNDNCGVIPSTNNCGQIGSSDKNFYRCYFTQIYKQGSEIGTLYASKPTVSSDITISTSSLSSGVGTEIASFNLPGGTYIVVVNCVFNSNSNGDRALAFSKATSWSNISRFEAVRVRAAAGNATNLQVVRIVQFTNYQNTVKVWAYQNSGSTLGISAGYMYFYVS